MAQYRELRVLYRRTLERLRNEFSWYTKGTEGEFQNLLDSLTDETGDSREMTADLIAEISIDIYKHSAPKQYTVTSVMSEIARNCVSHFYRV